MSSAMEGRRAFDRTMLGGDMWHPSGVRLPKGVIPGVSSQAPQPPANIYQPFGLKKAEPLSITDVRAFLPAWPAQGGAMSGGCIRAARWAGHVELLAEWARTVPAQASSIHGARTESFAVRRSSIH